MKAITIGSLKFTISTLVVSILLIIPFASLDNSEYSGYTDFISLLLFPLYIYNFRYFNFFLETELEYKRLRGLTILLTIYYLASILYAILSITKIGSPALLQLLLFPAYLILFIVYIIKIFRIETDVYKLPLNLIALAILIGLMFYFSHIFIITYNETMAKNIKWLYFLYTLSDFAFIYLYWLVLEQLKSDGYAQSKDKYTLNGMD